MIRLPTVKVNPYLITSPNVHNSVITDLQRDMKKNGQREPIIIGFDPQKPDCFNLIRGAQRLKVCKNLQRDIAAMILIPETEKDRDGLHRIIIIDD